MPPATPAIKPGTRALCGEIRLRHEAVESSLFNPDPSGSELRTSEGETPRPSRKLDVATATMAVQSAYHLLNCSRIVGS